MKKTKIDVIAAAAAIALCMMTGCAGAAADNDSTSGNAAVSSSSSAKAPVNKEDNGSDAETKTAGSINSSGSAVASNLSLTDGDNDELFTARDLKQTADTEEAERISVSDGTTIDIDKAGVYIISGTASDCTIRVNAGSSDKVQLVLDGVNITNSDFPAIYVISADKCFITTAAGSENSLAVTGEFKADGDTGTDAVIFSKDDIVLNGEGSLSVSSASANGISGKDDVKFTGGSYTITSAEDSIEGKDSVVIGGGSFTIKSDKDGIHSENSDDDTRGSVIITDGSFDISAVSDGIQGNAFVRIDGGTLDITSAEGIEGTFVQINDGTINITASDDGINASAKSSSYETVIEFNGGYTTINMGAGDTDGVDSNGRVIVNGGTISVNTQGNSFDYDTGKEFSGGTIIINGQEVSEIPEDMMGGRGGFGKGGFGGDMQGMDGERPDFNGEMPEDGFGGRGGRHGIRPDGMQQPPEMSGDSDFGTTV